MKVHTRVRGTSSQAQGRFHGDECRTLPNSFLYGIEIFMGHRVQSQAPESGMRCRTYHAAKYRRTSDTEIVPWMIPRIRLFSGMLLVPLSTQSKPLGIQKSRRLKAKKTLDQILLSNASIASPRESNHANSAVVPRALATRCSSPASSDVASSFYGVEK